MIWSRPVPATHPVPALSAAQTWKYQLPAARGELVALVVPSSASFVVSQVQLAPPLKVHE